MTALGVNELLSLINFNSHAHVERDGVTGKTIHHDIFISTHTLTWSVTAGVATLSLPNIFQLTRSRGA